MSLWNLVDSGQSLLRERNGVPSAPGYLTGMCRCEGSGFSVPRLGGTACFILGADTIFVSWSTTSIGARSEAVTHRGDDAPAGWAKREVRADGST